MISDDRYLISKKAGSSAQHQDIQEVSIEVKQHHLFRYPSEWDPRESGKTKGGYLEGKIQLPKVSFPLRMTISTFPVLAPPNPSLADIHPTLIHVVRKGKGNRRDQDKEPVPNSGHWQQEFLVSDGRVAIVNKTTSWDADRCSKGMPPIPTVDDMFPIGTDMVVTLGKDSTQLNLIILSPKTEKRASGEEVSLSTILASRLDNRREVLEQALAHYKNSTYQKQVRLKVELFPMDSNQSISSAISLPISDTASKAHGAMDMRDATPLVSCSRGGRKVVMVSEFPLARDVQPRFQLYDRTGTRLKEAEDEILNQPGSDGERAVEVLKETIVFITPGQAHAERILREDWQIQLTARRASDGLVSKKKFPFQFLPHDYYNPCIFCHLSVDHQTPGAVTLAPPRLQPRPGLRKRKMSGAENSREVDDSSGIKIRGEGTELGITGDKTIMLDTEDKATEASQKVKCEEPVGQGGILNPVPTKQNMTP